jgi:hypothetical protein
MTLPRTLHLETVGGSVRLVSKPLAVINPANNSSVRYEIAAGKAPLLVTSDALKMSNKWIGTL